MRLVACPSCSQHVKVDEQVCLHCGARLRSENGAIGRTAGALLMGLSLTACPSDDGSETMGGSAGTSTTDTSGSPTSMSASSEPTGSTSDGSTFGSEADYGVAETSATEGPTGGSDSTSASSSESDSSGASTGESTSTGAESGSTAAESESMTTAATESAGSSGVVEPLYGVGEVGGG
jgi:hypothetical protein